MVVCCHNSAADGLLWTYYHKMLRKIYLNLIHNILEFDNSKLSLVYVYCLPTNFYNFFVLCEVVITILAWFQNKQTITWVGRVSHFANGSIDLTESRHTDWFCTQIHSVRFFCLNTVLVLSVKVRSISAGMWLLVVVLPVDITEYRKLSWWLFVCDLRNVKILYLSVCLIFIGLFACVWSTQVVISQTNSLYFYLQAIFSCSRPVFPWPLSATLSTFAGLGRFIGAPP